MHPAIIMAVVFVIGFIAGIKFAYFTVNKAEQIREEDVEKIKSEARNKHE